MGGRGGRGGGYGGGRGRGGGGYSLVLGDEEEERPRQVGMRREAGRLVWVALSHSSWKSWFTCALAELSTRIQLPLTTHPLHCPPCRPGHHQRAAHAMAVASHGGAAEALTSGDAAVVTVKTGGSGSGNGSGAAMSGSGRALAAGIGGSESAA